MPATDYLRNQVIDHVFRTPTFAKPTALYLALCTTAPTAAAAGTEVVGGSYGRVALAPLNANWYSTNGTLSGASSGTTGMTMNGFAFTFAAPTGDWGIIYGFELHDHVSAGNRLYYGVLSDDQSDDGYAGFGPFAVYSGQSALVVHAQMLTLLLT